MSSWKKLWNFIWHDDSIWSWLVNLALAFVIVKFILYPGIGLVLGTGYPIVAVVSSSMEHDQQFDDWWEANKYFYESRNITKEEFKNFRFKNGFNKGDIMILRGKEPKDIKTGEGGAYQTSASSYPVIHRVVAIEENGERFITKGDHNNVADPKPVDGEQVEKTGIAVFRIPYLGWIKIIFTKLIGWS